MPTLSERFRLLHSAQRTIAADLSVAVIVPRVVRAACEVVGVRIAALGVHDGARYRQCRQEGLADAAADAVTTAGSLEEILDALERHAGVARTATRTVEIRTGDAAFADLVVAAPESGRYSDDDVAILDALAQSIGSALTHATMFEQARRSGEWLHASGEIARALLAQADIDTFGEIVARAVSAADADYGHLVLPTPDGRLRVTGAHGIAGRLFLDQTYDPQSSHITRAIVGGRALRGPAVDEVLSGRFTDTHELGAYMAVPLLDALGTRGSVIVARRVDRTEFSATDLAQFSNYGAQVALAMQFADSRSDSERLAVIEHRDAASRQVGDLVLQRLFATGLGLASLLPQLTTGEQSEQLQRHIRDLDVTIEEIRSNLFGTDAAVGTPGSRRPLFPRIPLDPPPVDAGSTPAGPPLLDSAVPRRPGRGRRRTDWIDDAHTRKD